MEDTPGTGSRSVQASEEPGGLKTSKKILAADIEQMMKEQGGQQGGTGQKNAYFTAGR